MNLMFNISITALFQKYKILKVLKMYISNKYIGVFDIYIIMFFDNRCDNQKIILVFI